MNARTARQAVVVAARRLVTLGLSHGTTGNVSVRVPGGLFITPSGMPYDRITARDVVRLDAAGGRARGSRTPSTEWRMHCDVYEARPDAGAVVHAHPTYATTIACLRRDLPAVHYMVAAAGGHSVRCARYATFGTAELSTAALHALADRKACLLANHGLLALGADAEDALRIAEEVERVAELYWRTLAAGTPVLLDESEMQRVVDRFTSYGQHGPLQERPLPGSRRRG